MKSLFAGAALLALISGCASTAEPTKEAAANPADAKICTQVKQMGSNMKQKVCKTRAQWEAQGAVPAEATS